MKTSPNSSYPPISNPLFNRTERNSLPERNPGWDPGSFHANIEHSPFLIFYALSFSLLLFHCLNCSSHFSSPALLLSPNMWIDQGFALMRHRQCFPSCYQASP